MLKHNTTLEVLDLYNAGISSDGAVALANKLHHNTTLKKLDMSQNPVGERGALGMAEMLKHNNTLEELDLTNISATISAKGIKALVESLAINQHLSKLTLYCKEFIESLSVYQDHKERVKLS